MLQWSADFDPSTSVPSVPIAVRRISVVIRATDHLTIVFRATSFVVSLVSSVVPFVGLISVVGSSCSVGVRAGICVVLRFVPLFCTPYSVVWFPSSRRRVILVWNSVDSRTCAHRFCTAYSIVWFPSLSYRDFLRWFVVRRVAIGVFVPLRVLIVYAPRSPLLWYCSIRRPAFCPTLLTSIVGRWPSIVCPSVSASLFACSSFMHHEGCRFGCRRHSRWSYGVSCVVTRCPMLRVAGAPSSSAHVPCACETKAEVGG